MKRLYSMALALMMLVTSSVFASDFGKVGSDHKGGLYGARGLKRMTQKKSVVLIPFNTGEMVVARTVERLAVDLRVRNGDSGRPGMVFVLAKQDLGDGVAYYSGEDHQWHSSTDGGGSGRAGEIAPTAFFESMPAYHEIDISKGSLSKCGTGLYTLYVGYGILTQENETLVRNQAKQVTQGITIQHLAAAYIRDDFERKEKFGKVLKIDCT